MFYCTKFGVLQNQVTEMRTDSRFDLYSLSGLRSDELFVLAKGHARKQAGGAKKLSSIGTESIRTMHFFATSQINLWFLFVYRSGSRSRERLTQFMGTSSLQIARIEGLNGSMARSAAS